MTTRKMDMEAIVCEAMKQEVARIVAEEADAAAERVRVRVKESTARVTLSVMSMYELEKNTNYLTIRVKQGEPQ